MSALLWIALGWAPVWIVALWRRRPFPLGRVAMGAALVGFVGGMASMELRRHGLLEVARGAMPAFLGLRVEEILHFGFIGASGALLADWLVDRAQPRR